MTRATLDKLLTHSVANYQALFNRLRFHNHTAHHLGSLYLLGLSNDKLEKAYERMCEKLDPYEISPHEINCSNWRRHLGEKNFCKSYRDFFHEQLATSGTDWKTKFIEFLLDNQEHPMINGVIGGLAHPLIHIGYAFELDSQIVGVEALTMTAVCYNYLHEVVDQLKPPKFPSKSALEVFKNVRLDDRLPIYDMPGVDNIELTVKNYNHLVLSHYDQWNMNAKENIENLIEELFDLTVYVYGATHKPNHIEFDFFLLHLLTSMHAIRIIYSYIKNQQIFKHILLQFFYFSIVIYVSQIRPKIDEHLTDNYKVDHDKNWNYVINQMLNAELMDDSHCVKVIRALKDAEEAYGCKNGFYLKIAAKTIASLDLESLWVGGSTNPRQLNVLKRS